MMEWQFIVALVIAIPVILFPAAFVWYLNIGGITAAIKKYRERQVLARKGVKETVENEQGQPLTDGKAKTG